MYTNNKMNGPATSNKASNMGKSANQYKARTNFLLEHLASFTMKTSQETQIPAKERLAETKDMLAKGTLWTKEMEMRLTDNDIVLLDGETQDVIEVYPLSSISVVQHIEEDPDLDSVLLFTTQQTEEKYAATHLFQSDRVPAGVVATEIMKASSSKGAMPTFSRTQSSKSGSSLPPPPSYTAPQPPKLERERMDLYERSLVAQTIAAFSAVPESNAKRRGKGSKDGDEDSIPVEVLEARTNRDVQILNHCIDDIESLVQQTKRSAEAWKKLQKKKGKIKSDNPLALEARPPPESDFIDAFQKFKHAFNLLGKLRPYLHHPNAAELVHYLFVPLSLLVRCTNGPEKARGVLSPLLTSQAIELLQNCLSSKEMELWSALGPNWTDTKQAKPFKDMFIPPYAPVFKDGWVPPEYIGGKDIANISAAVAANAAAVAHRNDQMKHPDDPTSPTVLAAAAKFRRLTSIKREAESSPVPKKTIFKRGHIVYEFNARNTKELTVKQGEEISVLDDSRQWWCVRNSSGEIGFVPNTVVEVKEHESQINVVTSLPSPPSTAPPPIPTSAITSVQLKRVETTETSSISQEEERKVPFVELRHVSVVKKTEEESGPKPPPPPPMSPPPPTPPPVSSSSESIIVIKKTTTMITENEQQNALEKAVLSGGNLKKVDKEAIQKKREENQAKRMSSADLLNDELKRRMTGAGALTPRAVRKTEHEEVVMLTPDSGTTEVRDWLKSKNFSQTCIQALAWKTTKDLDKMSKEDFKKKCGDAEGARVYSQFAVQKSTWNTSSKGNELQFIMQKRKKMVDVKEQSSGEGNLRNIMAEARAVTDNDVTVTQTQETKRYSYSSTDTGMKPIMITAPQERQRPQSMVIENHKVPPPVRPRSFSQHKTSPPVGTKSRGLSFGNDSFVPPPPADYHEENEKSILTSDQVEAIIAEQKKQQELLMEHEKQFSLLERLQIQKRELEEQKKEYEELQKRQRQAELEDKQKELEKQIKAQQEELRANSTRIEQQNQLLSNAAPGLNMTSMMMSPRQFPVMSPQVHMSPQVQMVPVSGLPSQTAYLPMQAPMATGLPPYMGYSPVAQAAVPQMVTPMPSYTIPQ